MQRVLVVGAHPDDVDFGCAGTTAKLTKEGVSVSYCVITDGDAGGFDLDIPREDIPRIRRDEQTAAALEIGVTDLHFLGYRDGELTVTMDLRRDISRVIRQTMPSVVICQSPEFHYDRIYASHPDHRAAGEATLCAVYPDSRNPFAHPSLLTDGLDAWSVQEVWLYGHPNPDHFTNVSDTFEDKMRAIHAHESQLPDPTSMNQRVREWGLNTAEKAGLARGDFAEGFKLVPTGD